MGNHVSRLVLCATTAAGAGAVIATCSRCDCSESRTPPAPADPVLLRRDDEQLENSPRRAHLPPRTPSAVTRPVRLIQVQVVFRHGARLPSEDMDFSSPPVGSSRGSENHVWTKEDTKFDTRGLVPIKLLNSNAEVLSGGLSNGTIVQGSSGRLLLGGGRPGELSAVGWRESRALGERLRSRYLNPAGGPHSLSPAGGRGLPRGALFARTTAVKRAAQSAHAVLSGLERGLNLPSNLRAPLALRLNGEPQWMVYSRSGCPRLRQIFDQGMSDSVATAAAQQVMKKVKEKTGVEGRHAPTETYFGETTPIKELLQYQDHGTCRQLHGKALPPAVQDREGALWQQIDRTACFALCRAFVGGDLDNAAGLRQQALQLSMGRMLEHILQVMEWRGAPELCPWDTIDERAPDPVAATPRLFLYSGHDWCVKDGHSWFNCTLGVPGFNHLTRLTLAGP
eukprot:COSAG04_NODE_1772_length_5616_cov_6.346384_2_plen_452_part_00